MVVCVFGGCGRWGGVGVGREGRGGGGGVKVFRIWSAVRLVFAV